MAGELVDWSDNLIDGFDADDVLIGGSFDDQLRLRGAGSGTVLAINSFCRWFACSSQLLLAGTDGFDTLRFNARCPTGVRGTPPHLDMLATADRAVVAVTSRCTEYLGKRRARLAAAYDRIDVATGLAEWIEELRSLQAMPDRYRYLDAGSLVKYALGLGRIFPDRPVTLVYLFWEPVDVEHHPQFAVHRGELQRLSSLVAGSGVVLHPLSVADLLRQWEQHTSPGWLRGHVARLGERYSVAIGTGPAL